MIKIETMNDFKYISNFASNEKKDLIVYILSKVNLEEDKYDKSIYLFDGKNHRFLANETNYNFLDNDNIYFFTKRNKKEKDNENLTCIYKLNLRESGEAQKLFEFDFNVNSIHKINDDLYILSYSYPLDYPNYYQLSKEEKDKIVKEEKEKSFRQVIDEIPFYNDGGTFINRKRNAILKYIPSKNSFERISDFLDTSITDIDKRENKILLLASNFDKKMSMYNQLLEYDILTNEIKVLIEDNKYAISKAKYSKGNIYLLATDMKKLGINQNDTMYRLNRKSKEFKIYLDEDLSFGNATGTDVRLGANESFKVDYDTEEVSFIHTTEYKAELSKVKDGKLENTMNKFSSVDAFAKIDNKTYYLGYLDSKLVEIYDEDLNQLTKYNEEVLKDKYVAKPEYFEFESNEDILKGFVLKPKDFDENMKYPAILDIHGGPKTVYSDIYYHEMQVWANLGYFVIFTNPHGSSGRGDKFSDIRGKYGSIDYEDLMNFVDEALKRYENIDKNKLAVTGGSYGGFMTNWIITHTDRFKAAATQRSISNWISMYGVSDIGYYFSDDQNATKLPNEKGFEKIWEHSPLKYIENAKTPTLIIHSAKDYRCPLEQGYQLFTALRDLGVDTKLVMFKDESHGLSRGGKPKARIERLSEITNWFEKYIK